MIAALAGDDDVLCARIRRELASRGGVEPQWLARLAQTSAYRAVRMGHVLGDGDNIMLGVRLAGYKRPRWDSRKLIRITDSFFASRWGNGLDDADHRSLLESLLWYGTDYGPGDPLRWSTVKVEILLDDWLARKVIAPPEYLAMAPDLLRAVVGFAHTEVGVRSELTDMTLAAIDAYEPEFLQTIDSPGPHGLAALPAAFGADDPQFFGELLLDSLAQAVGGREELDRLDATPLPDEPFEWAGIPDGVSARVAEVLALIDQCCTEVLDVEYRTACRRVLARIVAGDPAVFRCQGRADTAAAAVVWTVGKANGLFDRRPGQLQLQVKDLMDRMGLRNSTVSQRAATMLRAGGFSDNTYVVSPDAPDAP